MAGEEWAQFEYLKAADYVPEMKEIQKNLDESFDLAQAQEADNDAMRQRNARETVAAVKTAADFSVTWKKTLEKIGEEREKELRADAQLLLEKSGYSIADRNKFMAERGDLFKEGEYLESLAATFDDTNPALAAELRSMNPAMGLALKEVALRSHAESYSSNREAWLIDANGQDRIFVDDDGQEFTIHTATPEQYDYIESQFDKHTLTTIDSLRDSSREYLEEFYWRKVRSSKNTLKTNWQQQQKTVRIETAKEDLGISLQSILKGEGTATEKWTQIQQVYGQARHRLGAATPAAQKAELVNIIKGLINNDQIDGGELMDILTNPETKVWTPGGMVQILEDKGWQKALGENGEVIQNAIYERSAARKQEKDNEEDHHKANFNLAVQAQLDSNEEQGLGRYLTQEQKQSLIRDWNEAHPNYELDLDEAFKNVLTKEEYDTKLIAAELEWRRSEGLEITEAMVGRLDPRTEEYKLWNERLQSGELYGLTENEYNIGTAYVESQAKSLVEWDGTLTGKPQRVLDMEAAGNKFFALRYKQLLKDYGNDRSRAMKDAKSDTEEYMKSWVKHGEEEAQFVKGDFDYRQLLDKREKSQTASEERQAQQFLRAEKWIDRNVNVNAAEERLQLLKTRFIPDSEESLAAIVGIANQGLDGPIPLIYKQLAYGNKLTPLEIANAQIELLNSKGQNPPIPLLVDSNTDMANLPQLTYKPTVGKYNRLTAKGESGNYNEPGDQPLFDQSIFDENEGDS